MKQSPYRLGFTTLETETRIDDLPVHGSVPTWLQGTLFRNGPAKFEVGEQRYNHWFDGLAMLHRFAFSGGRVSYANRFLHSRSYREAMEFGKIGRREFSTNPVRTPFQRVADFFFPKFTDNCSVSINKFGDEIVALTESPQPYRFDPETLETLGAYAYQDDLVGTYFDRPPALRLSADAPLWLSAGVRPAEPVSPLQHGSRYRATSAGSLPSRCGSRPICTRSG